MKKTQRKPTQAAIKNRRHKRPKRPAILPTRTPDDRRALNHFIGYALVSILDIDFVGMLERLESAVRPGGPMEDFVRPEGVPAPEEATGEHRT
jgi:hypothetical protein